MRRYYRKKYYSRNNEIRSFHDLLLVFVQIGIGLLFLFLLQYIIPVYIYIIEHPILLIPVGMVVLLVFGAIYYYKEQRKKARMRAINEFNKVMKLDWREFEEFITDILKQKGFHTLLGVGIKDGGVDVTATLGDKKFFVQCKHYGYENIGVEKIRELNGVMNGENVPVGGIFVTTSGFTSDAVVEANKYGIELWDKNYIIEFLKQKELS